MKKKIWNVNIKAKAKEDAAKLLLAVKKNIATAIMAAFALVIALSWNDAIQEAVNSLVLRLGILQQGYIFKIMAAIIVTVICVIFILLFSRWAEKK